MTNLAVSQKSQTESENWWAIFPVRRKGLENGIRWVVLQKIYPYHKIGSRPRSIIRNKIGEKDFISSWIFKILLTSRALFRKAFHSNWKHPMKSLWNHVTNLIFIYCPYLKVKSNIYMNKKFWGFNLIIWFRRIFGTNAREILCRF